MPGLSALNVTEKDTWMYERTFATHPFRVLVDSLAFHKFMALKTAKQFDLDVKNTEGVEVELEEKTLKPDAGTTTAVLTTRGLFPTENVFCHRHGR